MSFAYIGPKTDLDEHRRSIASFGEKVRYIGFPGPEITQREVPLVSDCLNSPIAEFALRHGIDALFEASPIKKEVDFLEAIEAQYQ